MLAQVCYAVAPTFPKASEIRNPDASGSVTLRKPLEMPSGKGSEAQLQRDVVKACKEHWPAIAIMASASGAHLAGGRRSGRMMKLSGVEAGDPDLNIREWGRNGEPGAYIELKVPGGVVSDAQRRQHAVLRERGHAVFVLYSLAEFMSTIAEYLPPDFDASDASGNAARGAAAAAAALGLRQQPDAQPDADGGGQHSEQMAPADNGSSTDGPGAPAPGSSANDPIEVGLEPEVSGAGAESEGGGGEGSRRGTWASVLLGAGEAAGEEAEVPPETEVDGQWAWDQEADCNDNWADGYGSGVDLDDESSGDGYKTPCESVLMLRK